MTSHRFQIGQAAKKDSEGTGRFLPCLTLPSPLIMFVLSFLMYVVAVLPILLKNDGLFFYYGDYNVQQVPFYILAHRAVRSGEFFWHFGLDLGGSLVGDLSFYLMGSPFFWLTIPFPEQVLPYLMPFLMALKYATGATLAYLYIRRFTFGHKKLPLRAGDLITGEDFIRHETVARIGGLLYAFSGFNACNIVFNHFTDAVCFFPLLLMTFDDLAQTRSSFTKVGFITWLRFTLCVALLAVINYFFLFGMVIFLVLYAVVRYFRKRYFEELPYMFLRALLAGVIGMMCAAFFLMMALDGVAGNTRLSNMLTGYTLIVYPDAKMYFDILKSMVMTPDIIGRGTLFYTSTVKNASLAFYLPLFGVAGIAAYLRMMRGKRDWKKSLLYAFLVIALIPGLNAMFSLLNTQYYARWYYMPVLFAALATALALDRAKLSDLRFGSLVQIGLFLFFVMVYFLPSTNKEGELLMFNMSENARYFKMDAIVTALVTAALAAVLFLIHHKLLRIRMLYAFTIIACVAMTINVLTKGDAIINDRGMRMWKEQMLDTKPLLPTDEGFYRVEADGTSTNYEMVWDYPTLHCFLSTVPAEIFDFYKGMAGITRSVESEPSLDREGLRALLSAGYFIWNSDINDDGEFGKGEGIYGYDEIVYEGNGMTVFKNKNFIPMGFTFDYYIRESFFETLDAKEHDRLLVEALVLPDEAADLYGACMQEMTTANLTKYISDQDFDSICAERRETACTSFEVISSGFRATTADLERESLVFFSVPNTPGFQVTVDGVATEIITCDYGMMAVPVQAGIHEIEAVYVPRRLKLGMLLSAGGVFVIVLYGLLCLVKSKSKIKEKNTAE